MPHTISEPSVSPHPSSISFGSVEGPHASDAQLALALIQTVAKMGAAGYSNQFLIDGELLTLSAIKQKDLA